MTDWIKGISSETWIIIGSVFAGLLVVAALVALLRPDAKPKVMCICPSCGASGYPKTVVPGSVIIEFCLIFFFILPGVFYALIRELGTRRECPLCGNEGMVPADSPKGLQLQKQFYPNQR
jgi:hypothetical protein